MNLTEAAKYQDALDAVENGTANSVQFEEAEAAVAQLFAYLRPIRDRVSAYRQFFDAAGGFLGEERRAKMFAALDGKGVLPEARIKVERQALEQVPEETVAQPEAK